MYACNIMTCHGVDVLGGIFTEFEYESKNLNADVNVHIQATLSTVVEP